MTLDLPVVAFDMDEADLAWIGEHPDEADEFRERRMAKHIIERILQKDPAARVLIWVGYGHAYKHHAPGRLKMMADWLWELSGEEPFSCYQQTGEPPQRWVDLVIRHPQPTYQNGRPDWLRTSDACSVRGTITPAACSLVQLHLAQEDSVGTPVDQYLTEEDGAFELLTPQGTYLLRWWSLDGQVIGEREVELPTGGRQIDLPLA